MFESVDANRIAKEARLRGDPQRGAIVLYASAAACAKCHVTGKGKSGSGRARPMMKGDIDDVTLALDDQQRWVVRIPAGEITRAIDIVRFGGAAVAAKDLALSEIDPATMTEGGDLRWPEIFETIGYRGFQSGAYAVDTISIPESTPWNTWFRTSAIDFFPDGRMAVATVGGDVWIVSGIDDDLLNVRWKRFAGGMFEPFGIKVADGLIYVTCRDRLTRLHDLNKDGEADFYESFSVDTDVSTFFHAFNFDLQTDAEGNFYYAKSGQFTDYKLPGAIVKVSADGKCREVICTGLRTPNGMGILPDGRLTVSDNQGTWMPGVEDQSGQTWWLLRLRAEPRWRCVGSGWRKDRSPKSRSSEVQPVMFDSTGWKPIPLPTSNHFLSETTIMKPCFC